MKKYSLVYIVFLLFLSSAYAEDVQPSVQHLIQQVKIAKVQDRRLLMNQLKVKLRKMNKESRRSVMMELKKSFSKESGKKKLHKHKNRANKGHKKQCEHQPKYRHLRRQNGNGQGEHRGEGNGRK